MTQKNLNLINNFHVKNVFSNLLILSYYLC